MSMEMSHLRRISCARAIGCRGEIARLNRACLGTFYNSLTMNGLDASARPWLSYVSLITVALLSSPTKRLRINDIYAFIERTFPYYRHSKLNWRNNVRHNLSLNDCFVKVDQNGSEDKSRNGFWTLHPDCWTMFDQGSLLRRRRRFKKSEKASTEQRDDNACVMPILQKISDELTRWRMEGEISIEKNGTRSSAGDSQCARCGQTLSTWQENWCYQAPPSCIAPVQHVDEYGNFQLGPGSNGDYSCAYATINREYAQPYDDSIYWDQQQENAAQNYRGSIGHSEWTDGTCCFQMY